jgi:hypothetical protein
MRPNILFALLLIFTMCTSKTEVYVTTFNQQYSNGRSIDVTREDRYTKWKGVFTGIDYGGENTFYYSFNVLPDKYAWEGKANQVPLALVFCPDNIYLKVTERIVKYDSLYGPAHFKDTTLYFKNIDERYFFKLLGDQYFAEADSVEYDETKIRCKEVSVPYL